jgi:putative ABC transport system ATP-binding protein
MENLNTLNAAGATLIMVTHSQSHADQATRQVDILDGQLVASVAQVL